MGMLLTEDESFLKLVLYGKSGTGKTSIGVTAPRPLILLSERQGFRSVRDAARRIGAPVPPTMYLETADDLRVCLRALRGGAADPIAAAMREVMGDGDEVNAKIAALPYTRPDTIVCDSMTDFFRLVAEDVLVGIGHPKAKDGQEVRNDRYWDLLRQRGDRLVVALRDLTYHVIMLCLLDDRMVGKDEDERSRVVAPDTNMRAFAASMVAACNACGQTFQSQRAVLEEGKTEPRFVHEWKVMFRGPRHNVLKSCEPLRDVETPDATDWILRVLAHDKDLTNAESELRKSMPASQPEAAAAEQQDAGNSDDAPKPAQAERPPTRAEMKARKEQQRQQGAKT